MCSRVLLVAVLAFAACAKPPEAAIGQAREALTAAETAGAPKYAPEAWNRAKQTEAALDAELLGQNGKFALLRGYKKAAGLAEELAAAAAQATGDAVRRTGDDLLKQVRQFVAGYEAEDCPPWLWEDAILQGYAVFRYLKEHRRGKVIIDAENRKIIVEALP